MGFETEAEIYQCSDFEPAGLHDPILNDLDNDFEIDLDIEPATTPRITSWDPLAQLGVIRDGHDRPLILPDPAWGLLPGMWPDEQIVFGQWADGRRPFSRASTVAKWNDLAFGLSMWKLKHCLLSLARRPDMQAKLCGLTYQDRTEIDQIIGELLMRASDDGTDNGKLTAANRGTAFHALSVPGAPTIDPIYGPTLAQYKIATDKFYAAIERAGLELVDHELFGVNYAYQIGGRVDHLVRCVRPTSKNRMDRGEMGVLDKKTGDMRWISYITQLAIYARLRPHDYRTGVTGNGWGPGFNPERGLIAATSIETGECKIISVDTPERLIIQAISRYHESRDVQQLVHEWI